jgi:hypothetical protein
LLNQDAQNIYLAGDDPDTCPMAQLQRSSITCRLAFGHQQDRTVFTLQTLPAGNKLRYSEAGKVAGFSPNAGVAAGADDRTRRDRLCRFICCLPRRAVCDMS